MRNVVAVVAVVAVHSVSARPKPPRRLSPWVEAAVIVVSCSATIGSIAAAAVGDVRERVHGPPHVAAVGVRCGQPDVCRGERSAGPRPTASAREASARPVQRPSAGQAVEGGGGRRPSWHGGGVASADLETLLRWEGAGGTWELIDSSAGGVELSLLTCGRDEVMGRLSSEEHDVIVYVGTHDAGSV